MSTVETRSLQQIEVKTIDADWTAPDKLKLHSIVFRPGAIGDKVSIKAGADTGPEIFPSSVSVDASAMVLYLPDIFVKPVIDLSDSTLSAGHKIIFTMSR